MNNEQIQALIDNCGLPDTCHHPALKETHISWVVLTDHYAFKIKRPVKYSFLDFSSPEKRKFFCHEELKLNKRLEPEMYLKVIPVTHKMIGKSPEESRGKVIDHALQMKRMDNEKEMIRMLQEGKVNREHIHKLAKKTAAFHRQVKSVNKPFDTGKFQEMYADIQTLIPYLKEKEKGTEWVRKINHCVKRSEDYLQSEKAFLKQRVDHGFQRDCHGDLNATNIFLYDDPVIFDCIEFNKDFRYIDVLNEIAFLGVDLDFFDKTDLCELLYQDYCSFSDQADNAKNRRLFSYYKSYRANIRAKVNLIQSRKTDLEDKENALSDALKYIGLMEKYLNQAMD